MRKESLENLILTGHIEDKRDSRRQLAIYLAGLCGWMAIQGARDLAGGEILLRDT